MEKKIVYGIIGLVSILLVILGVTYAFWVFQGKQTNFNIVSSQCFKLYFLEDQDSSINLEGYPMSDEDGITLKPYTFQIKNECDVNAQYTIQLEIDENSTLHEQYIKSKLNDEPIVKLNELTEGTPSLSNAKKSLIIEKGRIGAKSTKSYEYRMWLDGTITETDQESMNKTFISNITVHGENDPLYYETILNGTDPIIEGELLPVTINKSGKVFKADTTKEWYSYAKKTWANAVILNDSSISYNNGEEIPESNIESYFVWIPRYRYQLFNNGLYNGLTSVENKPQEIKVVFENKETQLSKGTKKGDWLTHPAFTSFDSNGMWVGKFETGYKGATTTAAAQVNSSDSSKIQIKPSVYSWRNIQVANAHLASYNYKRDLDSHMMKNTEWGAVAYLQHSIYGSMANIRINNNSAYITGYSAVNEPTCGFKYAVNDTCNKYESTGLNVDGAYTKRYNTEIGNLASTTSNISGVYDMSGGAIEFVMGVMADQNGKPVSGISSSDNTGFNGNYSTTSGSKTNGIDYPESKYYDLYPYSTTDENFSNRILGDATGEIGPFYKYTLTTQVRKITSWYQNEGWFVYTSYPVFARGAGYDRGTESGVFASRWIQGSASTAFGYRLVLTPGGSL